MKKNNYFYNFLRSYHNIFFRVLYFEIFYSIRFRELLPKIKIQNSAKRTDTVPCIYYFLHEISKFLEKRDIKSIIDVGSGYGRVVNFISLKNKITCHGIEYDKEVFKSALKIKKKKVNLYCGDVLTFNLKKLKSKCFILVDPFKKANDNKKFLSKIKKIYPRDKKYVISINNSKGKFSNEFKLIHSIIGSKTRTLKIFEIN
jgi:SAM-dependent methyltransferase